MLAEISDFICFKIKVVFTPSSYNVSASCSIIYNQTVCPFQYIQVQIIITEFEEISGFPQAVGAIDGVTLE